MNDVCDLYFVRPSNFKELRFLSIFDKSFSYRDEFLYEGFLGVSVNRVKLIPLVSQLRKAGAAVYSVPIEYRCSPKITRLVAFDLAKRYAQEKHLEVMFDSVPFDDPNPLVWRFPANSVLEERAGGSIAIDRLDGHVWTFEEEEVYMYDYNNCF